MTTDISLGVRWDPINQQNETINQDDYEFEYDGGNSSSRLFERSRIKALAGKNSPISFKFCEIVVIIHFKTKNVNTCLKISLNICGYC